MNAYSYLGVSVLIFIFKLFLFMKCKLPELLRIHQECCLMVSGIKRIAIANWEDTYKFTSSNDCNIDSIDLNDEHFYEISFSEGSAYANANVNAGSNSEQKSVQHQVGFVLPVIDCKLIDNWKNYLLARVIFAVETKSNQVFIFGADSGLSPTNFDYSTGATETDTNGITALFEASQTNAPLIVQDWSLIEALYPQDEPTDYSKEYLTFEALEDGTFTLNVPANVNSTYMTSVSYSTDDGANWITTTIDNTAQTITTPTISKGSKVLWKGIGKQMAKDFNDYSQFSSTGNFSVSGNIMSLLYGDEFQDKTTFPSGSEYNFANLFKENAKLVSAENLVLPATTLARFCYNYMFAWCNSLTTAPELPATTLEEYCYNSMFRYCRQLTTAPELPATALETGCYSYMFQNCISLNRIKMLGVNNLIAHHYFQNWVEGVAANGTFFKNVKMTTLPTGVSGIPENWTVISERN